MDMYVINYVKMICFINIQCDDLFLDNYYMLNLKQCFFIIYKYTKLFKKKYPQGDGLAFWRNIKPILAKYDDNTSEWANNITNGDLHNKYFNIAMNTQEECILGNGNKKINAPNHFFIQIFRIPTKKQCH